MDVFEKVFTCYYRMFLGLCMQGYGLSFESAEDIIQDVFVRILKRKDKIKIEDEAGIRYYTQASLRNACLNYKRRPHLFVDIQFKYDQTQDNACDSLEMLPDFTSHPLYEILLNEEMHLRDDIIKKLPEKYQETVYLSFLGYSRKEIVEKLGIKDSTIKNYLNRGLKKYEDILNKVNPLREI